MTRMSTRARRWADLAGEAAMAAVTAGMLLWAGSILLAGCGGDAGVELAASDALLAVADQLDTSAGEYHAEVADADTGREDEVTAAFVARIQAAVSEGADEAATGRHVSEFRAALAGIREDRETEWTRFAATRENVGVIREVSRGLTRLAIESLSLKDEARRYVLSLVETRKRANSAAAAPAKTK